MATCGNAQISQSIQKEKGIRCPDSNNVLSHTVSLQTQCLLSIIGHLDEIPVSSLSLLPRPIRIQLLLLLPVIDVCKLENTPVTSDIDMSNEIWEILYKERIPRITSEQSKRSPIMRSYGPDLYLDKEERRWTNSKEAFFFIVFSWNDFCRYSEVTTVKKGARCGMRQCYTYWYTLHYGCNINNLLYSISSLRTSEYFNIQRYSNDHSNYSVFNLQTCSQDCNYHFIPKRYYLQVKTSHDIDINQKKINNMNETYSICQISLKHLCISPHNFKKDLNGTSRLIPQLMKTVQNLHIKYCFCRNTKVEGNEADSSDNSTEKMINIIFNTKSHYCISSLIVQRCPCHDEAEIRYARVPYDTIFGTLLTHLTTNPSLRNLKELNLSNVKVEGIVQKINDMLTHLQELEKLSLNIISLDSFNERNLNLTVLFHRPMFKELNLKVKGTIFGGVTKNIDSEMFADLLREFFLSPYPVSFSLNTSCDFFKDPPMLPFNCDQPNKCLEFRECVFPRNFISLLPPCLVFKSLILHKQNINLLFSLDKIKSISVQSITAYTDWTDLPYLCSLISDVVTTQDWNIFFTHPISDPPNVDRFCEALSTKISPGILRSFGCINTTSVRIFETIFQSLIPTEKPYFELYLKIRSRSIGDICSAWEKCGRIELKKIVIFLSKDQNYDSHPYLICHSFLDVKKYIPGIY